MRENDQPVVCAHVEHTMPLLANQRQRGCCVGSRPSNDSRAGIDLNIESTIAQLFQSIEICAAADCQWRGALASIARNNEFSALAPLAGVWLDCRRASSMSGRQATAGAGRGRTGAAGVAAAAAAQRTRPAAKRRRVDAGVEDTGAGGGGAGGFLAAEGHLAGFTDQCALYQGARELVENALGAWDGFKGWWKGGGGGG